MLETHGGLRAILRKYGIVRLIDGAMREAWESWGMRILYRWGRGPEKTYGWLEGFFSPRCDFWIFYTQVIAALNGVLCFIFRCLVVVSS